MAKTAKKRAGRMAVRSATRSRTNVAAKSRGSDDEAAVRAAATKIATAIRTGDKAALAALLARDFSFIDAAGQIHARRDVIGAPKSAPKGARSKAKVATYGRVALVTGAIKSAQAGERHDLFALDVWVRVKDGWQALIHHDNVLARPHAPAAHAVATPRPAGAPAPQCRNPLQIVPYQPKTRAEGEVIKAFQRMEKAVTENDAAEWVNHVADEFVVYRTNQQPTTKDGRVAFIRKQAAINAETHVAEIERMKLWVFGDAAVMRADHVMPGNRRPPYRATRLWVKRGGRWQMAVSQQTTVQSTIAERRSW